MAKSDRQKGQVVGRPLRPSSPLRQNSDQVRMHAPVDEVLVTFEAEGGGGLGANRGRFACNIWSMLCPMRGREGYLCSSV